MADNEQLPDNLIRLEPKKKPKDKTQSAQSEEKNGVHSTEELEDLQTIEQKGLPAKAQSKEEIEASSKRYPKITSIQAQKRKGRYNIFLDGQYAFPVDEALIVKHLLRKGMEISPDLRKTLEEEDAFRKAYQRSLNYLSYGLRSEKEVREDLIDKEYEDHVEAVIEKLKDQKLLDDLEYAKAYVRTAAKINRKGPRVIQKDLFKRGIDEYKIQEALLEYPEEDQIENAVHLSEKQWKKGKRKSQRETVQKVKQYLMQKGFDREIIEAAIEAIDTEKDEDEEYEALVIQGEKAWKRYARKAEGYELKQKTKAYLYNKGYPTELINQFIDSK